MASPRRARADQVDLHDHRGRPGQALVDAEQHVGRDHPAPGRRPDQQQRHRQADQPAGDQHGFAAVAVRQRAGGEVGRRLDGPKATMKVSAAVNAPQARRLRSASSGSTRALLADHPADQGVDRDQQGELGQVGPQPQPQPLAGRCRCLTSRLPGCGRWPRPVARAAPTSTAQVAAAGALQHAGGGHGPLAVPAHHRQRPGGRPWPPARPPSSTCRAGQVPAGALAGLADVEHRAPSPACSGPTSSRRPGRAAGGPPGGHAAGQLPDELLVADVERLAHQLVGGSWSALRTTQQWPVGVHQPAQPGGELRPQRDRQRAGDVPAAKSLTGRTSTRTAPSAEPAPYLLDRHRGRAAVGIGEHRAGRGG